MYGCGLLLTIVTLCPFVRCTNLALLLCKIGEEDNRIDSLSRPIHLSLFTEFHRLIDSIDLWNDSEKPRAQRFR